MRVTEWYRSRVCPDPGLWMRTADFSAAPPLAANLSAVRGQELVQLGPGDDRHVAPDRALQSGQGGSGIDGLLRAAADQGGPEIAGREGVPGADAIHQADRVALRGPRDTLGGEDRAAGLAQSQRDRGRRGQSPQCLENALRRAFEVEDRR